VPHLSLLAYGEFGSSNVPLICNRDSQPTFPFNFLL
jgi:hypothetical protein